MIVPVAKACTLEFVRKARRRPPRAAPGTVIDVSANGVDWRQRAEPRKYVWAANIPGMDDGIAACKCRERLRPQQAMSIGNRANDSHPAQSDYRREILALASCHGEPPHRI